MNSWESLGISPGLAGRPALLNSPDHIFHGHGKLLLSGEYLALEGARALGFPCRFGQTLSVKYSRSFNPVLTWRSERHDGSFWFEERFEFWRFNILGKDPAPEALFVQKLLRQARRQNPHFLRDEVDVEACARPDFPLEWGLGSSSTLVHLVAQWAYTGPFELLFKSLGGSGVDVACAQADGPILYQKGSGGPTWSHCPFDPPFKHQLFFVHLGKKRPTLAAVEEFRARARALPAGELDRARECISAISSAMAQCQDLASFQELMAEHEQIIGALLEQEPVQAQCFPDFPGRVKSLGAWGGDFVLAAVPWEKAQVQAYFKAKGLTLVFAFDELVLANPAARTVGAHGLLH